ncbi:MAG TPA: hypothetical protein VK464_10215 [Symbiobacteriaceae bacterium]|nr:hypothetical protein [Symbiobacteriaceae bacterium]
MSDKRLRDHKDELLVPLWDPEASERCIVCNRPSGGKAICSDVRCADELARS